ncbi:MAG: hypothetical protein LBT79_03090 [Elusimicrobiota bacterium]|jgi:hypothetical protein|nr:hypothetical protein [Elusimicrobiota bacterium]
MATKIRMKHEQLRLVRNGFIGFSGTMFFFGPFVPLLRGDFKNFLIMIMMMAVLMILGTTTAEASLIFWVILSCIYWIVMCCIYNQYYTIGLLKEGYIFDDSDANIKLAIAALNDNEIISKQ